MAELTVVTWNCQGRSAERLELAAALDAWQPDILLLQEANADGLETALAPQFQSRLWWPSAGSQPGILIASHLQLLDQGHLEPIDPPWDRPRACWVLLRWGATVVRVAAVHLAAPLRFGAKAQRDAQRLELAGWAEALLAGDEQLIIGGDFNTIDPALPRMTDACAAAPMPTWRPLATGWLRPLIRIDAIFVAPTLHVLEAGVGSAWRGSDHIPVIARIGS